VNGDVSVWPLLGKRTISESWDVQKTAGRRQSENRPSMFGVSITLCGGMLEQVERKTDLETKVSHDYFHMSNLVRVTAILF